MFNTFKNVVLVPIASFAAMALMPAPAYADGGDYLLPAFTALGEFNAEDAGDRNTDSCAEARKAAWFLHEVERSDGDVSPTMPNVVACNREIHAASDD
jgi:hypothetical protein